jgi:hypothetical protein
MKFQKIFTIAGLLLLTALPVVASANTMSTTLSCPVCHMPMTPVKTSVNTVPLLVHGKKWYCCAFCGAGKSAASYEKAHKGKLFVAEK